MKNNSYAGIIPGILPKALPLVPVLTEVGYAMKGILGTSVNNLGGLMSMLDMGQDE